VIVIKGSAKPVTVSSLRKVKIDRPDWAKSQWKGILHSEMVDTLIGGIQKKGWTIPSEPALYLSRQGADLFGGIPVTIPKAKLPKGIQLSIGLINSNSGRSVIKIAIGATVTVCGNGMVTGEILLKKRHTKGLNLQEEIWEALEQYHSGALKVGDEVDQMRTVELDDFQKDSLLMQAGRSRLMPWSRIGRVDKEYNSPRFDDFRPRTMWSLFNAFTYVVKMDPPHRQMDEIYKFRNLLVS